VMEGLLENDGSKAPETVHKGGGDVLFDETMSRRRLLRRVILMPD